MNEPALAARTSSVFDSSRHGDGWFTIYLESALKNLKISELEDDLSASKPAMTTVVYCDADLLGLCESRVVTA
jgi:hypothetical protein